MRISLIRLAVLDLSWNNLCDEHGRKILNAVALSNIKTLNVSYNALGGSLKIIKGEPAINEIVEVIMNHNIETVNISYNAIDFDSMYAISYAIQYSFSLQSINISGNPIGSYGVTLVLQAVKENRHQLIKEVLTDEIKPHIPTKKVTPTIYVNPQSAQAEYSLNLELAYDRVILKRLLDLDLQLWSKFTKAVEFGKCFANIRSSGKPFKMPVPSKEGNWEIENMKTVMKFKFSYDVYKKFEKENPNSKPQEEAASLESITISKDSFAMILANLDKLNASCDDASQMTIVSNICNSFSLWTQQVAEILKVIKSPSAIVKLFSMLFMKIVDRHLRFALFDFLKFVPFSGNKVTRNL